MWEQCSCGSGALTANDFPPPILQGTKIFSQCQIIHPAKPLRPEGWPPTRWLESKPAGAVPLQERCPLWELCPCGIGAPCGSGALTANDFPPPHPARHQNIQPMPDHPPHQAHSARRLASCKRQKASARGLASHKMSGIEACGSSAPCRNEPGEAELCGQGLFI